MQQIKNYIEQGGEKTIISGTLEITTEGQLTFNNKPLKPAANQTDSKATTIEEITNDFNTLLQKLRTSGIITLLERVYPFLMGCLPISLL